MSNGLCWTNTFKRSDFTSITRSYTLPQGTTSLETLIAVARSLAPDPVDVGAIRLRGVGLSGLTELHQDALFEQEFVPEGRSGPADDDEDESENEMEGEDSARVDGSIETCRTGRATAQHPPRPGGGSERERQ